MNSLGELLTKYPAIRLANDSDNGEILDFYNRLAMKEQDKDIYYDRSPDYFAFLKERSKNFIVFLIIRDESIEGICSISFRQGYIQQNLQTIGYVGDLRIKTSYKNSKLWRRFADDFFKYSFKFQETSFCDHYYTAFIDSNIKSNVNFLKKEINGIRFKKISAYNMINFLYPIGRVSSKYSVEPISRDHFIEIFNHDQFNRLYGFAPDEVKRRLETWNNFDESNLLAIKRNGHIIGVASYWDPSQSKKIIVDGLDKKTSLIYQVARSLTPLNLPQNGDELKITYLNQIFFKKKNPSALKAVLFYLHKIVGKDKHMISYLDYNGNNFHKKLQLSLFIKIQMGLYELRHKSRPSLDLEGEKLPSFEMSLV